MHLDREAAGEDAVEVFGVCAEPLLGRNAGGADPEEYVVVGVGGALAADAAQEALEHGVGGACGAGHERQGSERVPLGVGIFTGGAAVTAASALRV